MEDASHLDMAYKLVEYGGKGLSSNLTNNRPREEDFGPLQGREQFAHARFTEFLGVHEVLRHLG